MRSEPKIVGAASDKHAKQMRTLAKFCGAERIKYEDLGSGEDYTLTKRGKVLIVKARGNKYDGGFLAIERCKAFDEEFVK